MVCMPHVEFQHVSVHFGVVLVETSELQDSNVGGNIGNKNVFETK